MGPMKAKRVRKLKVSTDSVPLGEGGQEGGGHEGGSYILARWSWRKVCKDGQK